MLFVLIALWLIAIILLLSDPGKSSIRWLSGVAWCGGFGALSALTADILIPYAQLHNYSAASESFLFYIKMYSSLLQNYGLPYCFVMFAISYNPIISERWKNRLFFLLLLPILAMGLLFDNYPVPKTIAALWAIPYVLSGTYIVLRKKENIPSLRQNHKFTSLAVLPAVLLSTFLNFVMPFFGLQEMWRYNTWIILFAAIVFVVAIFNFGFMGIQFIIHKRKMEFTFRTITSGTSILNHAIKNDVGKMKLYCDKIKTYAEESSQTELASDVQVILSATRHIQDMIQRVHQQTQETVMRMEPCDLTQLIERMIAQAQPLFINIHVKTSFRGKWELDLDPVHIAEVFNNLMTNAVDAMPQGGELKIRVFELKKLIMIQVKDSGMGIEKQHLKLVMEPFFTTKNRMNFGLGLAYCYNVMKKHGGNLELDSEVGKGTSVYLSFPKRRKHGNDQSTDHRG
jgi:signal transduction histidine kinase